MQQDSTRWKILKFLTLRKPHVFCLTLILVSLDPLAPYDEQETPFESGEINDKSGSSMQSNWAAPFNDLQ